MALFDHVFSPMRMSLFDRDPFGHDFGGHHIGSISSFNVSYGFVSKFLFQIKIFIDKLLCFSNGNSRPIAKKTTKSTKMINGRRIVTTR